MSKPTTAGDVRPVGGQPQQPQQQKQQQQPGYQAGMYSANSNIVRSAQMYASGQGPTPMGHAPSGYGMPSGYPTAPPAYGVPPPASNPYFAYLATPPVSQYPSYRAVAGAPTTGFYPPPTASTYRPNFGMLYPQSYQPPQVPPVQPTTTVQPSTFHTAPLGVPAPQRQINFGTADYYKPLIAAVRPTASLESDSRRFRLTSSNRKEGWHKFLDEADRKIVENFFLETDEFDREYDRFTEQMSRFKESTAPIGTHEVQKFKDEWSIWEENLLNRRQHMIKLQEQKLSQLYQKVCQNFPLFITKGSKPEELKSSSSAAAGATSVSMDKKVGEDSKTKQEISPSLPNDPRNNRKQQTSSALPVTKPTSSTLPDSKPTSSALPVEESTSSTLPDSKPTSSSADSKQTSSALPESKSTSSSADSKPTSSALPESKPTSSSADSKQTSTALPVAKPTSKPDEPPSSSKPAAPKELDDKSKQKVKILRYHDRNLQNNLAPLFNDIQAGRMINEFSFVRNEIIFIDKILRETKSYYRSTNSKAFIPPVTFPETKSTEVDPSLPKTTTTSPLKLNESAKNVLHQTVNNNFAHNNAQDKLPKSILTDNLFGRGSDNVGSSNAMRPELMNVPDQKNFQKQKPPASSGNKPIPTLVNVAREGKKQPTNNGKPKESTMSSRPNLTGPNNAPPPADVPYGRVGAQSNNIISVPLVAEQSSNTRSWRQHHGRDDHFDRNNDNNFNQNQPRLKRRQLQDEEFYGHDYRKEFELRPSPPDNWAPNVGRYNDHRDDRRETDGGGDKWYPPPADEDFSQPMARHFEQEPDEDERRRLFSPQPAPSKQLYTDADFFVRPRRFNEEPLYISDLLDEPGRLHRPEKIAFIIRGLPGSGKSYLAKLIKEREEAHGAETAAVTMILSLDDYFMVGKRVPPGGGGSDRTLAVYEHNAEMENEHKLSLFGAFRRMVRESFFRMVIVDAVNLQIEDVRNFYTCAIENSYIPYVVEMEAIVRRLLNDCMNGEEVIAHCYKHSQHGRHLAEIRQLYNDWEILPADYLRVNAYALMASERVDGGGGGSADNDERFRGGGREQLAMPTTSRHELSMLADFDLRSRPPQPTRSGKGAAGDLDYRARYKSPSTGSRKRGSRSSSRKRDNKSRDYWYDEDNERYAESHDEDRRRDNFDAGRHSQVDMDSRRGYYHHQEQEPQQHQEARRPTKRRQARFEHLNEVVDDGGGDDVGYEDLDRDHNLYNHQHHKRHAAGGGGGGGAADGAADHHGDYYHRHEPRASNHRHYAQDPSSSSSSSTSHFPSTNKYY